MPERNQYAMENRTTLVSLAETRRGQQNLSCITCGDRLVVKHGPIRGKHFSHTAKSGCGGEGPAHYYLKTGICRSINAALATPSSQRNMHGTLRYACPDLEYGLNCMFQMGVATSGKQTGHPIIPSLENGNHSYDLLSGLYEAKCEVLMDNGKTRADIAGVDQNGDVIWVIEIVRTSLSKAAVAAAGKGPHPTFIIDISHLPENETKNVRWYTIQSNLRNGFYPIVQKSYLTQCERKEFGMGPKDTCGRKLYALVCQTIPDCRNNGCPECSETLMHECYGDENAIICPDDRYMMRHGIDPYTMYTDPNHLVNSHTYRGKK